MKCKRLTINIKRKKLAIHNHLLELINIVFSQNVFTLANESLLENFLISCYVFLVKNLLLAMIKVLTKVIDIWNISDSKVEGVSYISTLG